MPDHAYYDSLRARSDCWLAYSLRSDAQLRQYANKPAPYFVTYDPVVDAARVAIPPSYVDPNGVTLPTNSLRNQVRLPLGTTDGWVYTFVWDTVWTGTYLGLPFTHKAFQMTSGGSDGNAIWLQPTIQYASTKCPGQLGWWSYRSMNQKGGPPDWALSDGNQITLPSTLDNPLDPRADFCVAVNTWTRNVVRIQQRLQNYDIVDAWILDETLGPVQVLSGAMVSVRPTGKYPNVILKFWLEFNSSTDNVFGRTWDLVSYVRNLVVLRDAGLVDMTPILQRPGSSVIVRPAAPRDVRFA